MPTAAKTDAPCDRTHGKNTGPLIHNVDPTDKKEAPHGVDVMQGIEDFPGCDPWQPWQAVSCPIGKSMNKNKKNEPSTAAAHRGPVIETIIRIPEELAFLTGGEREARAEMDVDEHFVALAKDAYRELTAQGHEAAKNQILQVIQNSIIQNALLASNAGIQIPVQQWH